MSYGTKDTICVGRGMRVNKQNACIVQYTIISGHLVNLLISYADKMLWQDYGYRYVMDAQKGSLQMYNIYLRIPRVLTTTHPVGITD